jgi:hypothetical protein
MILESSITCPGASGASRILAYLTDLPDRLFRHFGVQSQLQKYIPSRLPQIKFRTRAVSSHRGAARDRHGRGAGCDGRGCAADEQHLMCTAKSCGPGAPTLASSLRNFRRRRWQKSPVTEEITK